MRSGTILILLCSPAFSQFAEFATTDDGRQLYFTSTLQFAGSPTGFAESRIYRIDDSGLALFVERGSLAVSGTFASGFGARTPRVSGDGNTIGYVLSGICPSSDVCTGGTSQTILRKSGGQTVLGIGALTLSRNARWALLTLPNGVPPINSTPQSTLINLDTGERSQLPGFAAAPFPVASDGTVILQSPTGGFGLWQQGNFTPVSLRGPLSIFAISDDAQLLVYGQLFGLPANPTNRVLVRNLATGNDTVIFSQPATAGLVAPAGLSSDGQKLLFFAGDTSGAGTAYIANTATGESTPLPLPSGEAVVNGTLSGNGNMVFLLTTTGRVASIDLANGSAVRTLIPPTPYVPDFSVLTPGSFTRIKGILTSSIDALAGHMFLDDVAVPILSASDKEVDIQVPWETKSPGQSAFRLDVATDSPFRQNQFVDIIPMVPRFLPLGANQSSVLGFVALRGDFSGLLTSQPHPGDIIIAYLIGLGPVDGTIATGQPAPLDHTLPIQGQFHCRFNPYGANADTLFAGLAPGLIGFYQVNFRLPSEPDPGPITGGLCTFNGSGVDGGFSWTLTAGSTLP
ncbi:MAG TPA: hypothetical protein VEU96_12240 [Bryobacteraceae bacterium]|nr:hypothetical protein [Bryobacteraceae bacterium]